MIGPDTRIRRTWSSAATSLTPGRLVELSPGHRSGEAQLDLVVGEVAQPFDAVHLDEAALADDRHPVAGAFDLGLRMWLERKTVAPSAFASRTSA